MYTHMHAHVIMVKVISLSERAYAVLKGNKGKDESFSDTVLRLAQGRRKLSEVVGLHPELAGKGVLRGAFLEGRRELDRRLSR